MDESVDMTLIVTNQVCKHEYLKLHRTEACWFDIYIKIFEHDISRASFSKARYLSMDLKFSS